jgi:cell division protein FtsQ
VSSHTARRRKPSAASRLRPFWIVMVLALALVAAFGYAFVEAPALRPAQIAVEGNRAVSREEILSRARVDMEMNLWLQNTDAMRARIEQIPQIADAHVRRLPPARLVIAVTERVPFAIVRSGRSEGVVDCALRVLAPVSRAAALPVLAGSPGIALHPGAFLTQHTLKALRDDQVILASKHIGATVLAHDRFGGLVVTLRSGVRVLFGDERDLEEKTALVDPILEQIARRGRPIKAIDLRALQTPVVDYE